MFAHATRQIDAALAEGVLSEADRSRCFKEAQKDAAVHMDMVYDATVLMLDLIAKRRPMWFINRPLFFEA